MKDVHIALSGGCVRLAYPGENVLDFARCMGWMMIRPCKPDAAGCAICTNLFMLPSGIPLKRCRWR